MKKIIIFGKTQFGELIYNFLKNDPKYEVVGFTVNKKYICSEETQDGGGVGKPVVEFENVENIWNPDEHEMIICVGYSDMNRQRQIKFKEVREKGYHIVGYRHPSSIVLTDDIGEGNIIMEGAVIGQSCKLGEGNVI